MRRILCSTCAAYRPPRSHARDFHAFARGFLCSNALMDRNRTWSEHGNVRISSSAPIRSVAVGQVEVRRRAERDPSRGGPALVVHRREIDRVRATEHVDAIDGSHQRSAAGLTLEQRDLGIGGLDPLEANPDLKHRAGRRIVPQPAQRVEQLARVVGRSDRAPVVPRGTTDRMDRERQLGSCERPTRERPRSSSCISSAG